jgi:tetratricopeptide (TPR) repeat protein
VTARGIAVVVLLAVSLFGLDARALVHIAKKGETLEELAVRYYGRRDLSLVIRAANGFVHPDDGRVTQGERIEVPEVTYYRSAEGDTWESLAERYLASKRRASFLAELNGSEEDRPLSQGKIVEIPYHLRHIFALGETLKSVARLYYGRERGQSWLRRYNLTRRRRFPRGSVVIVPLYDLELTAEEQARRAVERGASSEPSKDDAKAQRQALDGLAHLKYALEAGKYVELIGIAQRLLGSTPLTAPQEIGVHTYLAHGYVALGERTLAVSAFMRALELQPGMELSPITTSPKVLAAFEEARSRIVRAAAEEAAAPATDAKSRDASPAPSAR